MNESITEWLKPRTIFAFMFYATFLYIVVISANTIKAEIAKEVVMFLLTIVGTLMGFFYGQRAANLNKQGETQ